MKYNYFTQLTVQRLFTLVVLVMLGLSACNEKAKNNQPDAISMAPVTGKGYADTGSSSVKVFDQNGRVCIQQSNTSYEMVTVVDGKTKIPLLLKIRKTELCFADSINKDKVYEISSRSVLDTKSISWQTSFVATDISFKDNTLYAVKEGAETDHDYIRRFSLLNGAQVFSCSFADLTVSIPNVVNKFFVGYTSKRAASNPLAELKDENTIGVLRLGNSNEAIDSVKVKLKRSKVVSKLLSSVPDATLVAINDNATIIEDGKSVILLKLNEQYQNKDIQDFAVKLNYFYGDDNETTSIVVPIVNGRFDVAHAQYDKDIFELAVF